MIRSIASKLPETGILSGFMAGLAAAVVICVLYHTHGRQTVATVNVTGLINEFVQYESAQKLPPKKIRADVRQFGCTLEKNINQFAKKHRVILLPKEAVVAGAMDYTGLLRKEMKKIPAGSMQFQPDRE